LHRPEQDEKHDRKYPEQRLQVFTIPEKAGNHPCAFEMRRPIRRHRGLRSTHDVAEYQRRRLMATKKAPPKHASSSQVLETLQQSLRRLQQEADATLSRTTKRAEQIAARNRPRAVGRLVDEAQRVGVDLQERAARTTKTLESQAERWLGALEKQATKRLKPLLERLDLPTRQELNALTKRLAELERKVSRGRD
jgi:polyhydroxyalkanoate synthesis regulator phasin